MIRKIWILKEGLPLLTRNYEPASERGDEITTGGFLSAIDTFAKESISGLIKEVILSNMKLTYKHEESVLFVVGSDPNEVGIPEIFLPELIELFFAVFPKDFIKGWQSGDTSIFQGFESKLDQLRSAFENRIMTKTGTRRTLDAFSVMELPQRLQKTALVVLDAKTIPFEEIVSATSNTPQQEVANIQEILNAGFLYTTKMGNKVYYSVEPFPMHKEEEAAVGVAEGPTTEITASTEETLPSSTIAARPLSVESKKRDIEKGNMPFLIKQLKKNLDRVFNSIITRKLLLLIIDPETDKNQVLLNMVLDTLQCFAPDRELRIVSYATDFIHPQDADIIRIDRKLTQYYVNETILDMDKKKILHGESSVYLSEIIKQLSKLTHSQCISLLINRVALVEKLAQDWAKIQKLGLPSDDFIANARAKHTPTITEIMERVARNVYLKES